MMYRVLDMQDGSLLAVCFSEDIAKNILALYPYEMVANDPETVRYVYEDCFQMGVMENIMSQIDFAARK
jgi:hypothetical protein